MKAKIIFIEVEESRLHRFSNKLWISSDIDLSLIKDENTQPIKPVLVGEGEIKEGCDVVTREGKIHHVYSIDFLGRDLHEDSNMDILMFDNEIHPKGRSRGVCSILLSQDTEELYSQIAKGELVEGVWYEFEEGSRCCGRCNNVDDLCVFDRTCNEHNTEACTACWPYELAAPLKVVSETEKIHVVTTYNPEEGVKNYINAVSQEGGDINMDMIDIKYGTRHHEPNEVTEEEIKNQGTMTRTKEQTEAIITALTKLSEKFYADMDRIVNGGEIKPPQDTTSQESKDYWKNYYNN